MTAERIGKFYQFIDRVFEKSSKFSFDVRAFCLFSMFCMVLQTVFFLMIFISQTKIISELELTTSIVRLSSHRIHSIVSIFSDTVDVSLLNHNHINLNNVQTLSDSHGMGLTINKEYLRDKMMGIVRESLDELIFEENLVNLQV
jgi:hypothetical protein